MLLALLLLAASPTPLPTQEAADPTPTPTPGVYVPSGFDDAIHIPDGTTTPTPVATPEVTPVPTPIARPYRAPREDPPWPLQLSVAGGVIAGNDLRPHKTNSIGLGALQLNTVFSLAEHASWSGPFLGGGVEGTVSGPNGPYTWSGGAGIRAGYAWRGGMEAPVPDAYVYGRVTPFFGMRRVSDPGYLHTDDPVIAENGRGVRIAVGVVSPGWTAAMLGAVGSGAGQGLDTASSAEEAIVCLALGAVMLFTNHVELTWEVYDVPGVDPETLVGIRLGAGF